jgi:ParB family transcriptional regulator, chromosome partitioning protein
VAEPKRGMGRGLAAILAVAEDDGRQRTRLQDVAVELVAPNPHQPRRRFDGDALDALAGSLRERGLLQPVLVRPRPGGRYELVAGERRWRAARLAELQTIPALIQERDDADTLEAALIENMAREDLNPADQARAVAALVEELDLTREEAARRLGRSRVAISNLLRLLDLPDEVLQLLEDGRLSEGHGRALLLAEDHGQRRELARAAVYEGWSVRMLEDRARRANQAVRQEVRRRRVPVHPDQAAAAGEIADALGAALGTEVRVRPRGAGYKVELVFDTLDDALDLAGRVRTGDVG